MPYYPKSSLLYTLRQPKSTSNTSREEFVQISRLLPPEFLRVIDCQRSVDHRKVELIDWDVQAPAKREGGYTAISHTYGMDVYEVFDCGCAAVCLGKKPRANPAKVPCKQHNHDKDPLLHKRVIDDILKMCGHLLEGGVLYAWHDGVCISQYNDEEVRHFIRHMGWIYANAKETVIFLHRVGLPMPPIASPMAPIACGSDAKGLTSRWDTRVWTFQESVLSKRRRYCLCMGEDLEHCCNRLEFERKLASWYEGDALDFNVTIIEEIEFHNLLCMLIHRISTIRGEAQPTEDEDEWIPAEEWQDCLFHWINFMKHCLFRFPTIEYALENCSNRESKHEGDRINSILTLAGVQDFNAPKDDNVEESTLELFKRMEKRKGLAVALSATNVYSPPSKVIASIHQHTWLPSLCGPLTTISSLSEVAEYDFLTDKVQCEVLEDGCLELKGLLACVTVQFNVLAPNREEEESMVDEDPIGNLLRGLLNINGGVLDVILRHPVGPRIWGGPTYSLPHFAASLKRAGYIGHVFIPMASWDNWIDILAQWPYADALQRNLIGQLLLKQPYVISSTLLEVKSDFLSLEQGKIKILEEKATWPTRKEIRILEEKAKWPTVEHWCSDNGLSFRASLIFPEDMYKFCYTPFQGIIVQGDINAPGKKTKIGSFAATEKFHFLLLHYIMHSSKYRGAAPATIQSPITLIDNLVIR